MGITETTGYITAGITILSFVISVAVMIYNQGRKSAATNAKLDNHNAEMKSINEQTKKDMESKIEGVQKDVKQQITEVRADMNKGFGDVGREIVGVTGELKLVRETAKQSFQEGTRRMDRQSENISKLQDGQEDLKVQVGKLQAS